MIFTKRVGPALLAGAALALTLGAVVSCSKEPTGVDPAYTQPEGTGGGATRLVVWPTLPVQTFAFEDLPPIDPGPEDRFIETRTYQQAPDGTVLGYVLDGTIASNYQVMRREPNGGLRLLTDFVFNPARRWLDSHWEVYEFSDELPTPTGSYVGRGLVAGVANSTSPLTNEGSITPPPIGNLPVRFPNDSTGTWDPVPGTSEYLVHVFQYRQATGMDRILAATPAPFYFAKTRDYFLGLTNTPQTIVIPTHFNGSLPPAPGFVGTVLTRRGLVPGVEYLMRVTSVGGQGQLLAYSYGDSDIVESSGTYERFAQGSYVMPRPRQTAPNRLALRGPSRP